MTPVCLKVKRTDLDEKSFEERSFLIPKELASDMDGLKKWLAFSFEVANGDAPYKVFKLRNAKGALIPLTYIMTLDHPHESLNLEITNCRQTALLEDHLHNLRLLKISLMNRVDHLENQVPLIRARKDEDILRQVHELSSQVKEMSQKIDAMEASSSSAALV